MLLLAPPAAASAATEYALTVNVSGEGSVGCRVHAPEEEFEECASKASYPVGTQLTLTVNPNQSGYEEQFGAYEYHEFSHWGGACAWRGASLTCLVEMTEDKTVEAVFVGEPMAVTVGAAGSGGGTVECEVRGSGVREGKCASKYRYETELVLYATPNAESEFVEWEGCWVESEEECEVTVEEGTVVTTVFALQPLLVIGLEGSGRVGSRVECEYEGALEAECRKRYPLGAEVMLYPQAGTGAEFAGWGGACEGAEETCEVQMFGPQSATARFALAAEEEPAGEEEPPGEGAGEGGPGGGGGGGEERPAGGGSVQGAGRVAGSPPAVAPPARGTATVARLATVHGSMAALALRCAGGGACAGTLELMARLPAPAGAGGRRTAVPLVRIGGARFALSAGGSATLRLRIRRAAARSLARRGRLKANVTGSGVTPSAIVLKAARGSVKRR